MEALCLAMKRFYSDDNIINSEELVFNPYNSLNKEIQITNIQEILNNYGIFAKPFNFELYKRAFIHRSYTKKPKLENEESNIIKRATPEFIKDLEQNIYTVQKSDKGNQNSPEAVANSVSL